MQTLTEALSQNPMQNIAMNAGIVLMTVAATIGLVEIPEHRETKIAVSTQPAFVFATEIGGADSAQRRERDDIHPHHISYSAFQRTPGRTGHL
ncbi:MAG: hypothetical protein QFB86_03270 [Patescibacteria group bacterium]|nr:hypothetical protein [Patescibacteria group bacterium]